MLKLYTEVGQIVIGEHDCSRRRLACAIYVKCDSVSNLQRSRDPDKCAVQIHSDRFACIGKSFTLYLDITSAAMRVLRWGVETVGAGTTILGLCCRNDA